MLAYVFWHWPRAEVLRPEYEDHIRAFHDQINGSCLAGLRGSVVYRVTGAPWLPGGAGYEEWYLLEDTCALGTIDREAVSGAVGNVHHEVARLAAGGTAGLYKPAGRNGPTESWQAHGSTALWFGRPYGVRYSALYEELVEVKGPASAELWQRMLTLGPAPEFCLLQDGVADLPEGWAHLTVRRSTIWP